MTKKQLIEKCNALAKEAGEEVNIDGMTKEDISDVITELTATLKSRALTVDDEAKKDPIYKVANKKSITSLKGVLGDGAPVRAEYFSGGAETLSSLVSRGMIVKA